MCLINEFEAKIITNVKYSPFAEVFHKIIWFIK